MCYVKEVKALNTISLLIYCIFYVYTLISSNSLSIFSKRIEYYVNDIVIKATDPNGKPKILKETVATAWVDGADALGATVGNFCMDLAIRKAKESGIGFVTCKRRYHAIDMMFVIN